MMMLLAACGQAGAEPPAPVAAPPPFAAPKGWEKLPAIAEAARAALSVDGVTVTAAEAYGERAMGCYALRVSLRGAGTSKALGQNIVAGLATVPSIKTKDLVVPPGDGELSFAFERGEYRGRLRATLATGAIDALACFHNDREPKSCEVACK